MILNVSSCRDFVSFIQLEGIRPVQVDPTVCEDCELGDAKKWSNPASWPSGEVPENDDNVVINADMNIELDLPAVKMPKLKSLEINGQLTFDYGEDRAIKAHRIWVRAGTLNIGNATHHVLQRQYITVGRWWAIQSGFDAHEPHFAQPLIDYMCKICGHHPR